MRLTYSASLWNYRHYPQPFDLKHVFASLRDRGFGVELWSTWQGQDLYDPSMYDPLRQALGGMTVSLHTGGATTRELHRKQIDAAAEFGAPVLVLHSSDIRRADNGRPDVELTKWVVDYAAQRGVRLALENGELWFLAEALQAVPGLYACLDVGHVYETREPMRRFLDVLKPRLIHLHLQDTLAPAETGLPDTPIDHYIPGTGGIPHQDWQSLAETLRQIDFQGIAVFEIRPRSVIQSAVCGRQFADKLFQELREGNAVHST